MAVKVVDDEVMGVLAYATHKHRKQDIPSTVADDAALVRAQRVHVGRLSTVRYAVARMVAHY